MSSQSGVLNPQILDLLNDAGLSEGEAQRLMNQSGVSIDDLNKLNNASEFNNPGIEVIEEVNPSQIKTDLNDLYSSEVSNPENLLIDIEEKSNLETIVDEVGNVIIKKPATKGFENKKDIQSQLFQDVFASFIVGEKFSKTFLEFGATDGFELSNSFMLEKNLMWNGVCLLYTSDAADE